MNKYAHLKGTECTINDKPCYVADIDKELGITLHFVETDEEAYCLNKSVVFKLLKTKTRQRAYNRVFNHIVKMIQNGVIDYNYSYTHKSMRRKPIKETLFGTSSPCAFK